MKRIVLLALALFTLSSSVAFAQLEKPQPTTRSGAMIGDSYTFSWGRVANATWYELWISDARGVVYTQWVTAANAGCSTAQSASVCSLTKDWPLSTGPGEWWVQSWQDAAGSSGWGNGQKFTVAGRVPQTPSGTSITALGRGALQATGSNAPYASYGEVVAIGDQALTKWNANGTGGGAHTALGGRALFSLVNTSSSWSYNTALGHRALSSLTSGSWNTAVGWSSGGNLTSGSDNAYFASFGESNESATLRLGNGYQNRAFITAVSGVTSPGGVAVFVNTNGQLGTATSSARFKKNIRPIDKASERLFSLKPVSFVYNADIDPDGLAQYGLLAEDVEQQFPELLVRDAAGKPQTVRYHLLVPLLLNEAQKQRALVSALSAKTREQDQRLGDQERGLSELRAQIEALTKVPQSR